MSFRTLLSTACVVIAILLAGCGRQAPAPPAFLLGAPPGVVVLDDVPAGEPVRPGRPNGPALKSFQELLVGLPKEKMPKLGAEALIERNEAKEWLKLNALDKAIEFTLHVRGIDIQDTGEGRYSLDLLFGADAKTEETKRLTDGIRVDKIKVGDIPCQVFIRGPSPLWTDLDTATARRYRDLKNKKVVLQGFVDAAEFQETPEGNELILNIVIVDPAPASDPPPAAPKAEPPGEGPK